MFFFRKKRDKQKKTVRVSSIDFSETSLWMRLTCENIKVDDNTFIIADMSSRESVYTCPVAPFEEERQMTSIIKIDLEELPFLQKPGKWSLYVDTGSTMIRLTPTRECARDLENRLRLSSATLLTEAYITINDNLSIRTVKMEKAEKSPVVTDVNASNGTLSVRGELRTEEIPDNIRLLVQKRSSSLAYILPVESKRVKDSTSSWQSTIDFRNEHPFDKGTWDYYLIQDENLKNRLKMDPSWSLTKEKVIYNVHGETVEVMPYETVNHSFSAKHALAALPFLNAKGSNARNNQATILGTLRKSDLPGSADPNKLTGWIEHAMSETGYWHDIELQVSDSVIDELQVTFHIPYNLLLADSDSHKRHDKWDIYVQDVENKTDHKFRLLSSENNLADETRQQIHGTEFRQIHCYSTINDYIAIRLFYPSINLESQSFYLKNDNLILAGYAGIPSLQMDAQDELHRELVIEKRNSDLQSIHALPTITATDQTEGYHYFHIHVPLDDTFTMQDRIENIYNVSVRFFFRGETQTARLRTNSDSFLADSHIDKIISYRNQEAYAVYLRHTPSFALKLEIYHYAVEKMNFIINNQEEKKQPTNDIWLIGERPDTAQDTGYHFFRHCRKKYPDKEIYYVIEADSSDRNNLKGMGNVILFGSMEHLELAAKADTFIGSHGLDYILPTRPDNWPNYQKAKRIFLQHGVLGRKKIDYNKSQYEYPFHMFCVSSKREKDIVINEMGYQEDEVKITGLARFDELLENENESASKYIAVVPTWRDWLQNEEKLLNSAYYDHYQSLLTDQRLLEMLKRYDTYILFYPHYRMQPYIEHFQKLQSERVSIVALGEINVQSIIKMSRMLLTDYSSLSFDFNYMYKPTVFYHFDYNRFFKNGILGPKEKIFPGDIVTSHYEAVQTLISYMETSFREKSIYAKQASHNFKYRDTQNCARIYREIQML